MAYNADIVDALCYCRPQVGIPDGDSTLPSPAADRIWRGAYAECLIALRAAGLAVDTSVDSLARDYARDAEALLTSGRALRAQLTVAKDESSAQSLIDEGLAKLTALSTSAVYGALVSNGASASTPSASPWVHSTAIDDEDPDYDDTAGTGDRPYAEPPAVYEGDPT